MAHAVDDFQVSGPCNLSVRDYGGDGSPVLLLHGATRNLADWTPLASLLVTDHRVVAMDLRNHGHSGDGVWEAESVIDDVQRVIDAVGLDRPAVVGHSLGGMIGALFSARGGAARCVVNMDGYGMGQVRQYVGLEADAVDRYLYDIRVRYPSSWPGAAAPITTGDIERLIRGRMTEAAALGTPIVTELETAARSLRQGADQAISIQPSAARLRELYEVIADVDWFETFAKVKAPLLIYRCMLPMPFEQVGDRMSFFNSYREGLKRDLDALRGRSGGVTVRDAETHHLCNLSIPDILAAELHEFIDARSSADGASHTS